MGKIGRFEEIEAWQKSRELTREIYKITRKGDFNTDFGLRDQLRRAAVSSMSSIAEGFERGGNKEFHRFLSISKGSNGEIRSQLYIAFDIGYINKQDFETLYDQTQEVGRLIGGFMRYLKKSTLKGSKYKENDG